MSSAICQNFVQNAWKKELCSNCFKSKEEHAARPKPKPVKLIASNQVAGIIRTSKKAKPKRSVAFPKALTEIIGYGGEDWQSDDETEPDVCTSSSDDDSTGCDDNELDRELKRITKENTDFNTTKLNEEQPTPKKTTAQLMLGKPVVDSAGKKQTLLVSVTPFGEESARRLIKPITSKSKEQVRTSPKNGVILKSYTKNEEVNGLDDKNKEKSLLEEITETLENGKNPIQIISRKKSQKEIVLSVPRQLDSSNKENVKLVKNEENVPKLTTDRKVSLVRTPAVKTLEKPTIFQTSTAKIEFFTGGKKKVDSEEEQLASREQAGEPDGRADPETVSEPPALPLSPPPHLEPPLEKPKIANKPATVLVRKPPLYGADPPKPPLTTFCPGAALVGKRQAPRPPDSPVNLRPASFVCAPAPAPRHPPLSASSDCLTEGKAGKARGRFSLKKFLRMGAKEPPRVKPEAAGEEAAEAPRPKPRLLIVHPTELDGARVEVVAKARGGETVYQNVGRPAPPPRQTEEARPALPAPPKSSEVITRLRQLGGGGRTEGATETVYANIGEVRSAIVPNKPQRTASMREREAQAQRESGGGNYETIDGGENVYDYVNTGGRSSSPDSDSSRNNIVCNEGKGSCASGKNGRLNKRCESSVDITGEYFKFGNIPRSVSLTYCGSETESEIYSPYSFYGSESEITEDDHDWIQNGRTHKLRSRKGRSIVHKNLEDNYGAVIVANHEALAQVLENIQQASYIQPALRGLKTLVNLRWTDFCITPDSGLTIGNRIFYQALWNGSSVTLLINTGVIPSSTLSLGTFSLTPITEFSDLVPSNYIHGDGDKYIQATVGVLPGLTMTSLQSYADTLKQKPPADDKEPSFILLQLVNALKALQAQGIEELPTALDSFVLCKDADKDKDTQFRLHALQGLADGAGAPDARGTLCACALRAALLLQAGARTTSLIQSVLAHERAVSLTQVKSILEFSLWGPSDVALGGSIRERELALQRWLDLQRATVLHGLVCTRVQLTVYEECHLLFLVRSNARMMSDASLLLESSNMKFSSKV